ncbi:LapA family protein [Mycobacterium seoulense]|uniref:LapA family protein n=1 Tax=Mycobacterium seoulense TaxID=386911 RepID=UPI003CEDE687
MRHNPVDRDRTIHRHDAGPASDVERTPGLVAVGAAALAFVVCVATFALGDAGAGVAAAIVALLGFGAGLAWLAMDRRRIRQEERRGWPIGHPAAR